MAQLKDLIVAGSARLLGKTYFEDTVTINDTLEVDAIKADSVITPSLNSDGTALTVGGNISLTASGKYITVGDGTASTSTSTGVLRVVGGLNASKNSYFGANLTVNSDLIVNGNTTLGNAATDIITIKGKPTVISAVLTINSPTGSDTTLIFDRDTSANWRIRDSASALYFETDWYPSRGSGAEKGAYCEGVRFHRDSDGDMFLNIGNGIASGTDGAFRGNLRLYGTNTGYTTILPGTNNTSAYTLYLPGANGQLVYHTNDTAIGGSLTPVYVDSDGKATACTVSASGNRWGVLTSIGSDGVMEAGKYIDFHNTDGNTTDYSYRITTDASLLTGSGGIKATTTMESGTTMTVGTNLTVKSNAYFANGTTYKIDSSGHAVFNNTTANGNLTVNGNTALGNATTDTTTIKGAVSITYDGTAATGSTATALSNMKGAIKVLDGGIVTNKDVAAQSFYVHDKARMQYDTANNYVYFTFN